MQADRQTHLHIMLDKKEKKQKAKPLTGNFLFSFLLPISFGGKSTAILL